MIAAGTPSLGQILDALDETFQSFQDLLGELSPADWHRPTGCPGWDVHDVVSHIVGFEARLLAAPEQSGGGGPREDQAEASGPEHTHRAIAVDVERRRGCTPAKLMEEFSETTAASMAKRRASARPAGEITDGPFGWKLPYERLLSIRTFDCVAHEQDVRRAVGRSGGLDGVAGGIVEAFIFEVLPGVARHRVPVLDERPVTIDVTDRATQLVLGSSSSRTKVAEGGRGGGDGGGGGGGGAARPPESRNGGAATIRMPFSELLALACGRADVNHELISVDGDETLAAAVVGQMGFTP